MDDFFLTLLKLFLVLFLVGITLGSLLLFWVYHRLQRLRLPVDANVLGTLRAVPLPLVVALDLLDLGLDIFSAPIIWTLLGRFRLARLRNLAVLQALIPFTQPIPVLTLSWLAVRLLGLGKGEENLIETEEVAPGRYEPRRGRPS